MGRPIRPERKLKKRNKSTKRRCQSPPDQTRRKEKVCVCRQLKDWSTLAQPSRSKLAGLAPITQTHAAWNGASRALSWLVTWRGGKEEEEEEEKKSEQINIYILCTTSITVNTPDSNPMLGVLSWAKREDQKQDRN